MTTTRKVWLGFGTITAITALFAVALTLRLQSIRANVEEQSSVARPRSATARELEINVVGYALAIRTFIATDDPRFRREADVKAAGVERHLAEYVGLARSDRQRELAAHFDARWREMKNQGQAILDSNKRPLNRADSERLAGRRVEIETLLDDEIQPDATASHDATRDAIARDIRDIFGFALIVLILGVSVTVLLGATVSRAVAKGERAIAEQGERLRTTLASIGDAVISTDVSGNITYLNAVAESLTGWTNANAKGQPLDTVFRIVNESTRLPVENPARRALKEGVVVGLANHTLLLAKDGTERPIDDSAAPIRCADGEIVGCVLVFRDVAERHRSELALRRSETRKTAMFEAALDCIVSMNHDGAIIEFNSAAECTFGMRREDVLGRDLAELIIPPQYREPHRKGLLHYLATSVGPVLGQRLELSALHADGTEFPVELTVTRIPVDGPPHFTAYLRDITERKRAEDELRQSEEFNRSLMEGSADCVKVLDTAGRLLHMNALGLCLMEIDDFGPLCGHDWPSLWPEDVRDEVRRAMASARDGDTHSFQAFRPTVKGTPRWWDVTVSPVRNGRNGQITRLLAVSRDTTARKRASDELQQSEARFRAGIEAVSDIVWTNDARGMMAGEQVGWGNFTGQDREMYQGYGWSRAVHPDDAQPTIDAWNEAVTGKRPFNFEHRVRRSDGQWRLCSIRAVPILDDRGEISEWVGVHTDITDRYRQQEQLRQSEQRFRTLFESMDEGFCVAEMEFDPAGRATDYRIVEMNPAFDRQTGLQNILGQSVRQALPDLEEFWFETYGRVARTGEPTRVVHQAAPLNARWFDVYAFRLGDGSNRVAILFNDISERKQNERAREDLLGQLREADRRKDEFLATLAHELRNPLAPIRNGLEIMRRSASRAQGHPEEEVVAKARTMMERQLGQMVHLVDDLLDLSRVRQGKLVLRTERIDIASTVTIAVDTARPSIEAGSHTLTVTLPQTPVFVDGDATRLAQVFSNLLTNAAKYSPSGGRIALTATADGGGIAVRVADTGLGIPAEMLPKIFEMFTQVDASLEKSQGGLGIGLTLVKRLVEMHGGSVEANSAGAGRGSEFTVRLPVAASGESTPAVENCVSQPTQPNASKRILIADDNEDSAASLAMLLEILGHEIRTAEDGQQAVNAASEFAPEVVFLDIGMPKLNGYEACRRIRELPKGAAPFVIALTGWGHDDDRRQSREAGFDHHLVKPVDPAELEKLLDTLGRRDSQK